MERSGIIPPSPQNPIKFLLRKAFIGLNTISLKNTTYLFGAGASAGNSGELNDLGSEGIPVVRLFNKNVESFLKTINTANNSDPIKLKFIDELWPIFNEMKYHFSFDTYA